MRKLGSGGMGEAWLGVQLGEDGFEQRVCLKFINEGFRDTAQARELFLREAAIASTLRHSNIVGVVGADAEAGYMALELVDGVDLRTLLREAPGHRLPPPLVVSIAIELCRALEYAHTRTRASEFAGIVHRDVSPGNVLVSRQGEVKLADFGVAKVLRATGDVASAVRGKLSYMSPEQMRGEGSDPRSDLFSLGVLLYELLTGERPFDGMNDADTVRRMLCGEHKPLDEHETGADELLTSVVERLLDSDPALRFDTAGSVIDALSPIAPAPSVARELASRVERVAKLQPSDLDGGGAWTPSSGRRSALTHSGTRTPHSQKSRSSPAFAWQVEPEARSPRFGSRRAWQMVLGIVVFAGVAFVTLTLMRPPAEPAASNEPHGVQGNGEGALTVPAQALRSAEQGTGAGMEAPRHEQASEELPKPRPAIDTAAREPMRAEPAKESQAGARLSAAHAAAANPDRTPRATLTVGVFPAGQVWINGEPRGAAPLALELPPGAYTIAAGASVPEKSETLLLRAGGAESLVFDLKPSGGRRRAQ